MCNVLLIVVCLFVYFLLATVLSVLLSLGHCVVCSSVSWPLCCLFFCLLATVLSVLLSLGHCVVFPSSIYVFLLPLWYLQTLRQFNRIIVSRREIPVISEIRPTFVTAGYNISKRGARWLYLDRLNILLRRLMSSS